MNKIMIIILLSLMPLFLGCSIKFKTGMNKNRDYPDFVLGDFKYTSANDQGLREWELRASEAKMFNTRNEVFLYNMAMTFYNEKNTVKSFLSANSGYVNKANMNVFAEGKVKILSENQAILEANKVFWNNDKKQFYSEPDELVTLKRGNTIINGYKMVADAGLKEVTIEKVKANIKK